jgi:hypothetical protein
MQASKTRGILFDKTQAKLELIILCSLTLLSTSVWARKPISELRQELQSRSQAVTENFNGWQNVRKQILENKNKILEHRKMMRECLAKLRSGFDEKLYNSCSVDNYGFSYTLALMPKSSTSLNFPSSDFTGGSLAHSTLELTLAFHKWIEIGKRDVAQFIEMSKPLYETYQYNKLDAQMDAAAERGTKAGTCTSVLALTYEMNFKGARLKFVVAKAFGDLVGMNLALTTLKETQVQVNQTLKYCGALGAAGFNVNKTAVDQLVIDSETDLSALPLSGRVERFCLKMSRFPDEDIKKICKFKGITPEILSSIHSIVVQKISQGGQQ